MKMDTRLDLFRRLGFDNWTGFVRTLRWRLTIDADGCQTDIEFVAGMIVLSISTLVLAFAYLFHCCDWNIAMIAYGCHALLILIVGRTRNRWVQMMATTAVLAQTLIAMYGLRQSIWEEV